MQSGKIQQSIFTKENPMKKIFMIATLSSLVVASQQFALKEIINDSKIEVNTDKEAFIVIEDDHFFGKSYCNSFFGSISGEKTIKNVSSTMMACPEPIMQKERRFLEILTNSTISAKKDNVTISNSRGKLIFKKTRG